MNRANPLPQQRNSGAGAVIGVHAGPSDLHEATGRRQDARQVELALRVIAAGERRLDVGEDAIASDHAAVGGIAHDQMLAEGVVVVAFDAGLGTTQLRPHLFDEYPVA